MHKVTHGWGLVLLAIALLTLPKSSHAEDKPSVAPSPHQIVINVKGIVCSFCAHGAEKALSKIPGLDITKFGNDGVLVQIDKHTITLAMRPGQKLPVHSIFQAIRDAGYDPVRMELWVSGKLAKRNGRLVLDTAPGQSFALEGRGLTSVSVGDRVEVQGHLDAKAMETAKRGPVRLSVDRRI